MELFEMLLHVMAIGVVAVYAVSLLIYLFWYWRNK